MIAAGTRRELRVDDFDYDLPPDLIAQRPLPDRDASRLLVLNRERGDLRHSTVRHLPDWLRAGDLLVVNNSRVLAARLTTEKVATGGKVELLLLHARPDGSWAALARPSRRLREGSRLIARPRAGKEGEGAIVEVRAIDADGEITVALDPALEGRLADYGVVPLPPYIKEPVDDPDRYQTVYASVPGSAAAPTAGLHVTERLRESLRARGIGWTEVTLHIGLDTFRPVTVERVHDHVIHQEWCDVSAGAARAIADARARGGRVVAVGTTAARTLETLGRVWDPARPAGFTGLTDLFIVPGYQWRLVDALLTNFHLPRSTLLMMVSAFAGSEAIRRAYECAIAERYRFYSFGDAMLIL